MINVSPGACSIPKEISPRKERPELWERRPDVNFYRVFEEVVGINPQTRLEEAYKRNPKLLQDTSKFRIFYIDGNNYIRKETTL